MFCFRTLIYIILQQCNVIETESFLNPGPLICFEDSFISFGVVLPVVLKS